MDILAQLGMALGLASLAGVNLYLTVLLTGLAIRFDFVKLADQFQSLDVLAHPVVIVVAGLLFALQFCADKIAWVDSLWDSVHTFIRPVGGTLLALQAIGEMPGYVKVVAALLAGGAALTTHSAKAGTRLLINHSPEPVTNVAMSLAEDASVAGGVALTLLNPVLALMVFSGLLVIIWMLFPKLWRVIRTTLWLAWHKLKLPGRCQVPEPPAELKCDLNDDLRDLLRIRAGLNGDEVAWTVRCLSGRGKGVRGLSANLDGVLLAPVRPDCLYFAAIKGFSSRLFKVPLDSALVDVESKFLSENVAISGTGSRAVFRFPRGQSDLAEAVAQRVRESLPKARPPVGEPDHQQAGLKHVPFQTPPPEPGMTDPPDVAAGGPNDSAAARPAAETPGEGKVAPLSAIG